MFYLHTRALCSKDKTPSQMETKMIYEYELGLFVQADTEEAAFEKIVAASISLDELDYENETQVALVESYTEEQFDSQFRGKVVSLGSPTCIGCGNGIEKPSDADFELFRNGLHVHNSDECREAAVKALEESAQEASAT